MTLLHAKLNKSFTGTSSHPHALCFLNIEAESTFYDRMVSMITYTVAPGKQIIKSDSHHTWIARLVQTHFLWVSSSSRFQICLWIIYTCFISTCKYKSRWRRKISYLFVLLTVLIGWVTAPFQFFPITK